MNSNRKAVLVSRDEEPGLRFFIGGLDDQFRRADKIRERKRRKHENNESMD